MVLDDLSHEDVLLRSPQSGPACLQPTSNGRFKAAVLLLLLTAGVGCAEATGDPSIDRGDLGGGSTPAELNEINADGPRHVGKVSSALIAPTCTSAQREAAARGQEILARALLDAINAYSANTNNPRALEFFGARDEQQTLSVFYSLLWGYQTLVHDGQDFNIEYSCAPRAECEGQIAWSDVPYVTTVCDPDNPYFWQALPYAMAHEMWHWLGWGDPGWLGGDSADTVEEVRYYAQNDVAIAIQMPHAYYAYLLEFIPPHFTEAIY